MRRIFILIAFVILVLSGCQTDKQNEYSSAMESYKAILQSEEEFFCIEEGKNVYLNQYDYWCGDFPDAPLNVAQFTVMDLNDDEVPEVILERYYDGEKLVLHYSDGKIYGYTFVYRAMMQLKKDGTYNFSSGAADSGYGMLRFLSDAYEEDILGYSKPNWDKDSLSVSYYIGEDSVAEEAFIDFSNEQDDKEDVEWYGFSEENIARELFIR